MDPTLYQNIASTTGNIIGRLDGRLQETIQRNTILHVAVKFRNLQSAQQILHSNPSLLRQTNAKGDTPLHIAAKLGYQEMLDSLLDLYSQFQVGDEPAEHPLRIVNIESNTVLHEAVKNRHDNVVISLIQRDPSLSLMINDMGESPLFLAVDRNLDTIANRILQTFPNCSWSGRNGMTVMHAAVIRSQKILVEEIGRRCGHGILEVRDDLGWTPLHYVAHFGNVEFVRLFLQDNRSLAYIKDEMGMSPLHIAAINGQKEVVISLIETCPDVCELLENRDRTALHVAAKSRKSPVDIVKIFLKQNASNHLVNEKDNEGNTPLHLAAASGNYGILTFLAADQRVDVGAINNAGMTAFDIVQSDRQLSLFNKALITFILKRQRIQPSLEREVFTETYMSETLELNGRKIPQETSGSATSSNSIAEQTEKSPNNYESDTINNMANVNLLVATIIASITFAAVITMPGGYNTSDGMSVLRDKPSFRLFMVFDSIAFGCAAASMIIHFLFGFSSRLLHLTYTDLYPIFSVYILTAFSLGSATSAFWFGTAAVLKQGSDQMPFQTGGVVSICFCIPLIYFGIRLAITSKVLSYADIRFRDEIVVTRTLLFIIVRRACVSRLSYRS